MFNLSLNLNFCFVLLKCSKNIKKDSDLNPHLGESDFVNT